jgi:hypothetical protein
VKKESDRKQANAVCEIGLGNVLHVWIELAPAKQQPGNKNGSRTCQHLAEQR